MGPIILLTLIFPENGVCANSCHSYAEKGQCCYRIWYSVATTTAPTPMIAIATAMTIIVGIGQ
jgi:hypothetical protein